MKALHIKSTNESKRKRKGKKNLARSARETVVSDPCPRRPQLRNTRVPTKNRVPERHLVPGPVFGAGRFFSELDLEVGGLVVGELGYGEDNLAPSPS